MSAADRHGKTLVGTYGFGFAEWAKRFYPKGVPDRERLGYYATVFRAVEINRTYRYPPKPADVERWRDLTPPDFTITAKAPRVLMDAIGRLDAADAGAMDGLAQRLARFVGVMRQLGPRLGPIVLELSPDLEYPRGFDVLRALFARVSQVEESDSPSRLAVDFRHPSWLSSEEPAALLRKYGAAWVWNDVSPGPGLPGFLPRAIDDPAAAKVTADGFAYVRLSGSHEGKANHYTQAVDRRDELRRWTDLVRQFVHGRPDRTAYVMLSDHYAGAGPQTARDLQALLAP